MRRECRERFRVSHPDMHHGTCATPVPWCMPGSLTSGFIWSRWREKRSRHSRRMCNPQFYVSGKRPMWLAVSARSFITTLYTVIRHRGRVTHICVGKLSLPCDRCQAIIWTNDGISLIRPLGTKYSELLMEVHMFIYSSRCIWIDRLRNGGHLVSASMCP